MENSLPWALFSASGMPWSLTKWTSLSASSDTEMCAEYSNVVNTWIFKSHGVNIMGTVRHGSLVKCTVDDPLETL